MLALIAGRGALPAAVAAAQPTMPLICSVEGYTLEGLEVDLYFRLETLGGLLAELKQLGVTDVCLCGAIARPKLTLSKLDFRTLALLPKFVKALKLGDDGALRVLIDIMEAQGFAVRAAHELAPSLVMPAGIPTTAQPAEVHYTDAELGDTVLAAQGAADLGQACVIRAGAVIAREDDAGTDAMLAGVEAGTGGVLFKGPKPGQDRRADLPTIGPESVVGAAAAGLDGIVLQAGGVIVLDQAEVLARLDEAGMFLWLR